LNFYIKEIMNFTQRKAIIKEITELYRAGQCKRYIYGFLKERVEPVERAWISRYIAGLLPEEVKEKNRVYALLLMFIMFVSFIAWFLSQERGTGWYLYFQFGFMILMVALLNMQIYRFEAGVFLAVSAFGLVAALFIFASALFLGHSGMILWALFPMTIFVLSVWLRRRMFPEMNDWGNVRKDSAGNYVFNDEER
jgi:hypothetical protein